MPNVYLAVGLKTNRQDTVRASITGNVDWMDWYYPDAKTAIKDSDESEVESKARRMFSGYNADDDE